MEPREVLLKTLEKALDFERKGSEFYIRLGIDTKQTLAKNLFYSLAKQEIDHMVSIEEIFDAIGHDAAWPRMETAPAGEIEGEMRRIFDSLDQKSREKELDNIKGYELAIEMEKDGHRMYKEFSERATDDREKRFFLALAGEEASHLEALDNVYYFLTRSEDWLSGEESKVWNWMST